jgi:hypothetical protein
MKHGRVSPQDLNPDDLRPKSNLHPDNPLTQAIMDALPSGWGPGNRELQDHERCQVCLADAADEYKSLVPRATHLAPTREDVNDPQSRLEYIPVCDGHAADWLLDCESLNLGPVMQLPKGPGEQNPGFYGAPVGPPTTKEGLMGILYKSGEPGSPLDHQADLDTLVDEVHQDMAQDINMEGYDSQVDWLMEHGGYSPEEIYNWLKDE